VEIPRTASSNKTVRFGYLGNVGKKKGIAVLVQAFGGSLAKHLVIRGFPDETAILQFKKLFPDFHAKLELFDPDVATFYSQVDVVVVPSIWHENQPTVVIEAFAFGKPVLCSNLGGLAEMVQDGVSGILFRAGDPDDLRAKATYLCDNPSVAFGLARSVPLWPSIEEHVDRLLEAYGLLLEPQFPSGNAK
jgi:glycosyltransferase involved in cell wall biosynthesis